MLTLFIMKVLDAMYKVIHNNPSFFVWVMTDFLLL